MNPFFRQLARQMRSLRLHFIEGDQRWGQVRLLTALIVVLCFLAPLPLLQPGVDTSEFASALLDKTLLPPELADAIQPLLELALIYIYPVAWRYWIVAVLACFTAFSTAAYYVADVYELPGLRLAQRYLAASLFGVGYPALVVRNGQVEKAAGGKVGSPAADLSHPMEAIGGPGYLDVKPGSAALLERGSGPVAVVGAGVHFVRRFGRLRQVVDLHEQHRQLAETKAITRDGLPVTVRDIEATFRIRFGRHGPRSEQMPFPFSVGAIKNVAYSRAVGRDSGAPEWQQSVIGAVASRIRNWIASQRLDRLTGPAQEDPRAALQASFRSPQVRDQFARMGVELLLVSAGHFESPANVDEQRAATWSAAWRSQDQITHAQGAALQIEYERLAHAEAEAGLLDLVARVVGEHSRDASPHRLLELLHVEVEQEAQLVSARSLLLKGLPAEHLLDAAPGEEPTRPNEIVDETE